jgi:Fe-S cluster biogenesis protein NfuA
MTQPASTNHPLPQAPAPPPAAPPGTPVVHPTHGSSLTARVEAVLARIRPAVQDDGGDLELVEITPEGVARIRLHGACVGCPSSADTLHKGIAKNLCEKIPEIKSVEQVH